jgi:rhodanese-related sulfurtransferase
MASPTEITVPQLARLVGMPDAPAIVDVRTDEDHAADPRMIPASRRRAHAEVAGWAGACAGRAVVVTCEKGLKLSHGVAAWLRQLGVRAEVLEGGIAAWRAAGQMLLRAEALPPRGDGRSVWVTRERPKIDRIACPWLIRRFVDPQAEFFYVPAPEVLHIAKAREAIAYDVFLYVLAAEVEAVAERFAATPFDIDGVFWSHRGETCSFDTMLLEFGLDAPPLVQMAEIVRGADTARPDLAPQAAGLLAVSLGLSRMFRDDLAQLEAGMLVYDALYRWARDAVDETHNWPSPGVAQRPVPA